MQKSSRALTLMFTLLASFSAKASVSDDFLANTHVLLNRATAAGYTSFGDLNLSSFESKLSQLKVSVVASIDHHQNVGFLHGSRDAAEWGRQGYGSIALAGPVWKTMKPAVKPMLALHEGFGALRVSDDNFQCSSNIYALTEPSITSTLSRDELRKFEDAAQSSCQMAFGGSTGVTGGGDSWNVEMRMKAVAIAAKRLRANQDPAARAAVIDDAQASMAQGYVINNKHPLFDPKTVLNSVTLDRRPDVSTIRVFYPDRTVPQDSKNGWTYDAASNSILLHGNARPAKGANEGPGVLCSWAE